MNYARVPLALLRDRRRSLAAVYGVLSFRQGANKSCWPSLKTIASESGLNDRANVVRAINILADMGYVKRLGRGKTGSMQYAVYLEPVVTRASGVVKIGAPVVATPTQKETKKNNSTEKEKEITSVRTTGPAAEMDSMPMDFRLVQMQLQAQGICISRPWPRQEKAA